MEPACKRAPLFRFMALCPAPTAPISLTLAGAATAGMTYKTESCSLSFGGDAELNLDANNSQSPDSSIFGNDIDTKNSDAEAKKAAILRPDEGC